MSQRRQQIFAYKRELIEHCRAQSVQSGRDRPVVIVLDLADPFAKKLAIQHAGEAEVERQVQLAKQSGNDPLMIFDVEHQAALDSWCRLSQNGRILVESVKPENFVIAIVSDGGISWIDVPEPK